MDYNLDDVTTLGAKLDGLDLSDGERAILDVVLAREDDVVGHSSDGFGLKIGGLLDGMAPKPYFDGAGTHIAQDSINSGDMGSGRREGISGGDLGSGRRDS